MPAKKQRKVRPLIRIPWLPQPRQETAIKACGLSNLLNGGAIAEPMARIIGFGGSAGGGKTDTLLGIAILAGLHVPGINIAFFRREYPQLEGLGGAIPRSRELLSQFAKYTGDQHRWTFPNETRLQFCHCKDEADVHTYQSQQFDIILIDEATQFTRFIYRYLLTRNRATKAGITPFMVLATNPGNVGHAWFLSEFVDIGEPEEPHRVEVEPGIFETHMFIPSKLSDNEILEKRDPGYRMALMAQPEVIRRQLLEGDWHSFEGQYFKSWRKDIHTIRPFEIPDRWRKFRSLDYGLDCTACYWWAVDDQGRCIVYRELYEPDLNLTEAAKRIVELTPPNETIEYTVASPDLWNRRQDRGISGVETMYLAGLTNMIKADDRREAGWFQVREFLEPFQDEYDLPSANLRIFDTCYNLIRTLPVLIHDEKNPNDVSQKQEDHGPESIRYGCMSRPKPNIVRYKEKDRIAAKWGRDTAEYRIWSDFVEEKSHDNEVTMDEIVGFT